MKKNLYCDCHGTVKMAEEIGEKVVVRDRRNREHHYITIQRVDNSRIKKDNQAN